MSSVDDGGGSLPRRVYLDTQFVYAYLVEGDTDHEAAATMVERLRVLADAGRITSFVSVLVLSELAWRLAGTFFDIEHGKGAWYRSDSHRAHESVREKVAGVIEALVRQPWLRIASADEEACSMYPVFMHRFELCSADQAHLVIAATSGMDAILTHDRHFQSLEDSPVPIVSYRIAQ
jgi:predicted nucleic acid-binding protein